MLNKAGQYLGVARRKRQQRDVNAVFTSLTTYYAITRVDRQWQEV